MKYKIIRFHQDGKQEIKRMGLTLNEAQAHCKDDSTQSKTWFDGYTREG